MTVDDPHPEFRCACIGFGTLPLNPYHGRCHERPTQEDLLCDHCRRVCRSEFGFRVVPLVTPVPHSQKRCRSDGRQQPRSGDPAVRTPEGLHVPRRRLDLLL